MQAHSMESGNQDSPRSPVLCANGCGFFGNPATHNLCSKCYKDYLKEETLATATAMVTDANEWTAALLSCAEKASRAAPPTNTFPCFVVGGGDGNVSPAAQEDNPPPHKKNRCQSCNKKTGLTGFSCRCGGVFCGLHRHPEEHDCKNDFKTQGRTIITKQNPLCVKDKMDYRV